MLRAIALLALAAGTAGAQVNYIVPGALGDVPYHGRWTMDLYAPKGEPRPAALIIHGSRGNRRGYISRLCEQATRAGYAWFAPDYGSEADVAEALRFIRQPNRFNLDGRLVLIGEDTGARIALNLASRERIAGVATVGAKVDDAARPSVPVLMIQGTADEEFPIGKAEEFCRQLPRCSLYRETGARHVFENWLPAQWDYREELDAWLRNGRRGLWKDIAYARPGGRDLLMDAWIPEGGGPFPAVVIAHGGGWEGGDKITYIAPVFEVLAKTGIAWFSIDYTLLPYGGNDRQLEDLRTAIRYVRTHAARYHVDPGRIALLGESASGQMVTQVASLPCPGCEAQSVVSLYGVYRPGATARDEELRRNSPFDAAHAGMPPVLLVQGTGERLLAGSKEYAERLKQLGVRSELVLLEGAPHGMENWEGHPEWAHWKSRVVEWLRTTLR